MYCTNVQYYTFLFIFEFLCKLLVLTNEFVSELWIQEYEQSKL